MSKALKFFAAFVVAGSVALAAVGDVTGTWKWTTDRGGQTVETTLKLKQEGEKLTGKISGRNNTEIDIEEGKVKDDEVSFKVTRMFNNNTFVMTYKGKLEGDAIKGKISFEREGETVERDWEAKREAAK
jgi:hypothetical protein